MKNKVKIDDFLTLLYWVKSFYYFENKSFDYQNLLDQAETYKLNNNTPFDTSIHNIDSFMVEAYQIYVRLKETEEKVSKLLDNVNLPLQFKKEELIKASKNYENIFEDLIENYKYEDAEIRGIQKGFLMEKMNEYVASEDYEHAAKIRDIIKEC